MDKKGEHKKIYDCKYRDRRVIKTVNDLNELIKYYSRTNEKLNTYIIKKDKTKAASFLKSLTFYVFTQITSWISIFLVIFFVGFLIGYHLSPKSVLLNLVNQNLQIMDNEEAILYKMSDNYVLRLSSTVDFSFDYNNLFMGTLIGNMVLYYYPSNDIGVSGNEVCYALEETTVDNNTGGAKVEEKKPFSTGVPIKRTPFNAEDLKTIFKKFDTDESLIFLNSALTKSKYVKDKNITYMNDCLFSDFNAYPLGGSEIAVSSGILQGINYVTTELSINTIFDNSNNEFLSYLIKDCTLGRIYVQLHFLSNQVKTILLRIKPQKSIFLPFKIKCRIVPTVEIPADSEFRSKVIHSYRIQMAAARNINFFI